MKIFPWFGEAIHFLDSNLGFCISAGFGCCPAILIRPPQFILLGWFSWLDWRSFLLLDERLLWTWGSLRGLDFTAAPFSPGLIPIRVAKSVTGLPLQANAQNSEF
jgi:hypothetical protein